jgi:hypothetical protein
MEKFDSVSYGKEYTKDIRESNYVQTLNLDKETVIKKVVKDKVIKVTKYNSIEELIIYNYDYNSALDKKCSLNLNNIKMDMASKIDEDQENYYNKFKYNSRKFNKNKIQSGLQENNNLSTIVYLSDKYKLNIYLHIKKENKNVLVSSKKENVNKTALYIVFENGKYHIVDKMDHGLVTSDISKLSMINCNISNYDIYITYLKAVSNYKLEELHKIAKENDIEILNNGKRKTKSILYDEINEKMS